MASPTLGDRALHQSPQPDGLQGCLGLPAPRLTGLGAAKDLDLIQPFHRFQHKKSLSYLLATFSSRRLERLERLDWPCYPGRFHVSPFC